MCDQLLLLRLLVFKQMLGLIYTTLCVSHDTHKVLGSVDDVASSRYKQTCSRLLESADSHALGIEIQVKCHEACPGSILGGGIS